MSITSNVHSEVNITKKHSKQKIKIKPKTHYKEMKMADYFKHDTKP